MTQAPPAGRPEQAMPMAGADAGHESRGRHAASRDIDTPLERAPWPGVRPWWADAVGSAALASLVVVVALWLHNAGLQALGQGEASALTSLGRLTGLVAADFLMLQVLLMARIPWVERSWGQDRLARWHRVLGFASFWLMWVHIVTIVLGYAAGDSSGILGETWSLVTTYPGMLLATAGTACLVMVVVTSIRAARQKLRYESWHLLHLYAYLGVGLALPHQVWTGTDFAGSALARLYWWTLWCTALAAVLVFRLGLPLWRSWTHQVRVAAVDVERPGVVSVTMSGHRLDRLPLAAGQFLTLRFLDGPGWMRANPYSLSAAPTADRLRVTVQAVGDGSRRVAALRPGTRVLVEGPFGRLTDAARAEPQRPVVLLGAGVGITPLRALAEAIDAPGRCVLIQRARHDEDLLFMGELGAIAAQRRLQLWTLTGPRAGYPSWLPAPYATIPDADALKHLAPFVAEADVYVCGPPAWARAAVAAARDAGVPPQRIHEERFAW